MVQYLQSTNSQWSKSALHNKNKNKILNLQNYKTTLSSYKNIIILYNIITNFKKPRLELRFKRRKGITRSKFEWKCIPNRRCGNSKRPATISFEWSKYQWSSSYSQFGPFRLGKSLLKIKHLGAILYPLGSETHFMVFS